MGNRMIYCKLVSQNNGVLKYAIGGMPDDLSGTLFVDMNDSSFELEKEPEETTVYIGEIKTMLSGESKTITMACSEMQPHTKDKHDKSHDAHRTVVLLSHFQEARKCSS